MRGPACYYWRAPASDGALPWLIGHSMIVSSLIRNLHHLLNHDLRIQFLLEFRLLCCKFRPQRLNFHGIGRDGQSRAGVG
jgi:hypothetical protein